MARVPPTGIMSIKADWDKKPKFIRIINDTDRPIRVECTWHAVNVGPKQAVTRPWAWGLLWGDTDVNVWFNARDETSKLVRQGQTIGWDGHRAEVYE